MVSFFIPERANGYANHSQVHPMLTLARQTRYHQSQNRNYSDFDQVHLKSVLPGLYQHVSWPTREGNTPDHVYTNIKHAHTVKLLPHLGQEDQLSLRLTPVYTSLGGGAPGRRKFLTTWPEDALLQLHGLVYI